MRSPGSHTVGDFQYRFLRAVKKLDNQAFGATILDFLEIEFDERINPGQIYTTAARLIADGLLTTKDNQLQTNGRRATLFVRTPEGDDAFEATRAYYKRLSSE